MSKLRVWFVAESGMDVRLVEGLAERFELTVLARRIERGVEISQPPRAEVRIATGPASRVGFSRFVRREIAGAASEIDFVLVQGYSLAALAANLAGRAARLPVDMLVCSPTEAYYLCRARSPNSTKPFRRRELGVLRLLARINARVGQRYLVLSRYLEEVVRGHGGSLPVEIVPVYGVDTAIFAPPRLPKRELRARLELPETGSLLFFSSRIAPEKDAETLLAAVARLVAEGRDLRILHRSGGFRGFLADAARYGLSDRVIATDAVHPHERLPLDYQACDLCVQASREEGLGFSPLEALACEVPVVASAVGGLRETVVDGETGWSYPVGDVDALCRCIAELLDDPAEAARRAEAGRAMVIARYDRARTFDRLESLLRTRAGAGGR